MLISALPNSSMMNFLKIECIKNIKTKYLRLRLYDEVSQESLKTFLKSYLSLRVMNRLRLSSPDSKKVTLDFFFSLD